MLILTQPIYHELPPDVNLNESKKHSQSELNKFKIVYNTTFQNLSQVEILEVLG